MLGKFPLARTTQGSPKESDFLYNFFDRLYFFFGESPLRARSLLRVASLCVEIALFKFVHFLIFFLFL